MEARKNEAEKDKERDPAVEIEYVTEEPEIYDPNYIFFKRIFEAFKVRVYFLPSQECILMLKSSFLKTKCHVFALLTFEHIEALLIAKVCYCQVFMDFCCVPQLTDEVKKEKEKEPEKTEKQEITSYKKKFLEEKKDSDDSDEVTCLCLWNTQVLFYYIPCVLY